MLDSTLLHQISGALWAPLLYPFDPSRRICLLFLIPGLLLAFWSLRPNADQSRFTRFTHMLLDRRLWLNRSTVTDLYYLFLNSILKATLITPLLTSKLTVIVLVSSSLRDTLGAAQIGSWSNMTVITLFTFTLFIAEDFSRFFQHWLMHRIPYLWQYHRVHHSATSLTPLTLYRSHPVEMALSSLRTLAVIGGMTGLFVYLFPGQITAWEILGIDALGFLFNAAGANLRHSPFPLNYGRWSAYFISPLMHQLHHSADKAHHNINFGVTLTLWDRLWGSYRRPPKETLEPGALKFGLSTH